MTTPIVRAVHLPQHYACGKLSLSAHLLLLIVLLGAAFSAIWIATVADALHPYGKPATLPERERMV